MLKCYVNNYCGIYMYIQFSMHLQYKTCQFALAMSLFQVGRYLINNARHFCIEKSRESESSFLSESPFHSANYVSIITLNR